MGKIAEIKAALLSELEEGMPVERGAWKGIIKLFGYLDEAELAEEKQEALVQALKNKFIQLDRAVADLASLVGAKIQDGKVMVETTSPVDATEVMPPPLPTQGQQQVGAPIPIAQQSQLDMPPMLPTQQVVSAPVPIGQAPPLPQPQAPQIPGLPPALPGAQSQVVSAVPLGQTPPMPAAGPGQAPIQPGQPQGPRLLPGNAETGPILQASRVVNVVPNSVGPPIRQGGVQPQPLPQAPAPPPAPQVAAPPPVEEKKKEEVVVPPPVEAQPLSNGQKPSA